MKNADLRQKLHALYDLWTPDLSDAQIRHGQLRLRFYETRKAAQVAQASDGAPFILVITNVQRINISISKGWAFQELVGAYVEGGILGLDFSVDTVKLEISADTELSIVKAKLEDITS